MAFPTIDFGAGTDGLFSYTGDHMYINTITDGKNVRINSRNVTQATGDHSAVQIKPNKSVTGTGSITGLEVSPRFADACAGNDLRAILADPNLKGTTGNLTGQVVAVEANIDLGDAGSTRTITGDVSAFSSFLDLPTGITTTGIVSFLRVRTVNAGPWEAFANFDDANTGACTASTTAITSGTNTTYRLKCYVGDTAFYLMGVAAA